MRQQNFWFLSLLIFFAIIVTGYTQVVVVVVDEETPQDKAYREFNEVRSKL